jgi:hypothetical protein
MSEQTIDLKTVFELRVIKMNGEERPVRYHIPAYQRGYRWSPTQVKQLLDDVREFTKREEPKPQEFYCLQPLVLLATGDESFDVVDGQQRLTTLLLILRHLNERQAERFRQKLFTLKYETRPDLQLFLDDPSAEKAESNIDYYHIALAITTIENWFASNENEVDGIKSALFNQVKVIWYQLSPGENPVAVFTRLNVGKIPLTDGELIRALFLRRAVTHGKNELQLKIAYEWDMIEKALQRPDFWCFLSNNVSAQGNRIDFLFRLAVEIGGGSTIIFGYSIFNDYSDRLNRTGADPEAEWLKVKQLYMLLEEWFDNRLLFHLVGFLVWKGVKLSHLVKLAAGKTKAAFRRELQASIATSTLGSSQALDLGVEQIREIIAKRLEELRYGVSSQSIRTILLLFNLVTLHRHRESNMRFQFDSFKSLKWDIEHVRSVVRNLPETDKGREELIQPYIKYLEAHGKQKALVTDLRAYIEQPPKKEETQLVFEALVARILAHFKEHDPDESVDQIGNLALLDRGTNRSYGNSAFAIKRQEILSRDRDGVFIPLCTRNVFLKCYSSKAEHLLFWTSDDRDGYRQAIEDALVEFFQGGLNYV